MTGLEADPGSVRHHQHPCPPNAATHYFHRTARPGEGGQLGGWGILSADPREAAQEGAWPTRATGSRWWGRDLAPCTLLPLSGCDATHPPCSPPPQVCTKAPAQQQYSSQNLTEVVHCFIALGEAPRIGDRGGAGDPSPRPGSVGATTAVLPPAARSYPKELMKFFLSQMEMSKEAVRVGTLTLIRAVVSADGEPGEEGRRRPGEAALTQVWTSVVSPFLDTAGWARELQLSAASHFLSSNLTSPVILPSHPQLSPCTRSPSFPLSLTF